MGLSEALSITTAKVHGGVLLREVNVARLPTVEGFLGGGSYRGGLLRTLVLPSGGRRKRW